MSDNVLHAFPSNESEALAFLYVQQQNLSWKTSAELHTMYQEAYYEILKDHHEKRNSGWYNDQRAKIRQSEA